MSGIPRKSHYCVAKAGLRILTKVLERQERATLLASLTGEFML